MTFLYALSAFDVLINYMSFAALMYIWYRQPSVFYQSCRIIRQWDWYVRLDRVCTYHNSYCSHQVNLQMELACRGLIA